ncbi:hypothetical protein Gohar_019398 [Gossypium harknessii]|uniref:Uncharacterized protein n=1 Tax=Gossypium harknessii TaxID=34285 RepID=A0A7J9I713_9ROSI|nr:hypothetical protein [Gossypium harknessii]
MKTKEKRPAISGAKSLKMMAVLDASSHASMEVDAGSLDPGPEWIKNNVVGIGHLG